MRNLSPTGLPQEQPKELKAATRVCQWINAGPTVQDKDEEHACLPSQTPGERAGVGDVLVGLETPPWQPINSGDVVWLHRDTGCLASDAGAEKKPVEPAPVNTGEGMSSAGRLTVSTGA